VISVELPTDEIRRAARDPEFLAAVEVLYADLDARTAARRPVCINRGACCQFEAFGHRLFVTPVELAYFLAKSDSPLRRPISSASCPYQVGGLCTVRAARPTGCRIFFCDVAAQHWQPDETEHTLARIRELHRRFDLPYAYVEWIDALRQLAGPRR
jgi:Fe-S-cluster containining protein